MTCTCMYWVNIKWIVQTVTLYVCNLCLTVERIRYDIGKYMWGMALYEKSLCWKYITC